MAWRVAKGLLKLRDQINEKYPLRSKASDGTIADAAHYARGTSDHIPNAQGVVTAMDITKDDQHGPNLGLLAQALTRDPRTKYVIYDARIWKARTGEWSAYSGLNAHRHHLHISIKSDDADDEHTWPLDVTVPPESYPMLKFGSRGLAVRVLQEKLGMGEPAMNAGVDGVFGPATEANVRLFQREHGLDDDGIVGPATWSALTAP